MPATHTTSVRQRIACRALLPGAAAAALAASLIEAAPSGGAVNPPHAPVVTAAYATVQGNEADVGQSATLPARKAFASNFAPPLLRHFAAGSYGVQIPNLGDSSEGASASGVVHARVVGNNGSCMSDDLENLNEPGNTTALLFIGVQCFDEHGRPADRPFTVSYTRGGTQSGKLVTARLDPGATPGPTGIITPHFQQSSVGGTVTVTKSAPGAYTFNLPALTGMGSSTLAVSPMGGFHGNATAGVACSIKGTALVSGGTVEQVGVVCRRSGDTPGPDGEPVDPGVALTYAKDINLLGFHSTLSTAYLTMPKTTAPFTVLGSAHNQIFGQTSGTVTVLRKKIGIYQVDLQNQQGGSPPETAIVTAQGANAACRANPSVNIPGSDAQTVLVTCRAIAGQPVDSAFQLQYTVHE